MCSLFILHSLALPRTFILSPNPLPLLSLMASLQPTHSSLPFPPFSFFSHAFPLAQVLGMLLHSKAHLINSHILHLTYTLVGTVDSEQSASITNPIAFRDLLASMTIFLIRHLFYCCMKLQSVYLPHSLGNFTHCLI